MKRDTTTLAIVSGKGGVGKSLLAQIMIIANDQAGNPLKVIEINRHRNRLILSERQAIPENGTWPVRARDSGAWLIWHACCFA